MPSKVAKMSAKDKAFENVKATYRHKIRELESKLKDTQVTVLELQTQNAELLKQHESDIKKLQFFEQFKELSSKDVEILLSFAHQSCDIMSIMNKGTYFM